MECIFMTSEQKILLAIELVRHKYYNGKKISNAVKCMPIYKNRLRKAILQVNDLVNSMNELIDARAKLGLP